MVQTQASTFRCNRKGMSTAEWKFGEKIPDYKEATELLLTLTDTDIARYLQLKAFGKSDPTEDDLPTSGRSGSLKCTKKMLSFFMPHKRKPWDEVAKCGNPTRSEAVAHVIAAVAKFEVRRQGVASQARREIELEEFKQILELLGKDSTLFPEFEKYRVACVLTMQWHMMARIDDMMKLQFQNISTNPHYPFTLIVQMRWSKNITEEREAPHQIVLGSMDEFLCPLLCLAVYAEMLGRLALAAAVPPPHPGDFIYGDAMDGHRKIRFMVQS